jgi:hypothetical protein
MSSPDSPLLPHSPGFYVFHSKPSIPPPALTATATAIGATRTARGAPPTTATVLHTVLPHLARRLTHSVTSVVLPIALLPFHLFFLFLSLITTLLALLFLSARALQVYLEIGMTTLSQMYSDYVEGGRKVGRRRRDLLRRVVLEREEAVRAEKLSGRMRGRGLTMA